MNTESDVILNYLKAAGCVAGAFFTAWVGARVANRLAPTLVGVRVRAAVFLLGSAMLLVATIGGLGWAIQTFDGTSAPEVLNGRIFKVLSIGGAFLLVYDYAASRTPLVKPHEKRG